LPRLQEKYFKLAFDDKKATFQDKKTGKMAFVCEKGDDGMFYLRGERQVNQPVNQVSFLATNTNGEWKDVTEQIDEQGKMIKNNNKLPKPKKICTCINMAHRYWCHKSEGLPVLKKTAKFKTTSNN
jgi:hypothetical protein